MRENDWLDIIRVFLARAPFFEVCVNHLHLRQVIVSDIQLRVARVERRCFERCLSHFDQEVECHQVPELEVIAEAALL